MLSDIAETIALALENNIDPMTSDELAESLYCTKHEAVSGLNELKAVGKVIESIGGYRIVAEDDKAALTVPTGNSDFEKVLFIFATMKKRAFLKSIAEFANISTASAGAIVGQLMDAQLVECRTPGTHYLTESGIEFLRTNYPAITIPAYVTTNAANPPPTFHVSRTKQKIKIPNLDRKLFALNSLLPTASAEHKKELTELVTILQMSA